MSNAPKFTTSEDAQIWAQFASSALAGITTKSTSGHASSAQWAANLADALLVEYKNRLEGSN